MNLVNSTGNGSGRALQPATAETAYFAEEARCWMNAAIAYGKAAVAASNTYPLQKENGDSNRSG